MWKFEPILKPTIWGGDRIIPYKGLDVELSHVGESWEISGVEGAESVVSGGPDAGLRLSELIERYGESLLGKCNYAKYGNRFPLLVKFIDARTDLSVQVHPNDELARRDGLANGKNEMWYVVRAGRGARLANGFKRPVQPDELDGLLADGSITDVLNYMDVHQGEVFYIPSGRVHAICGGTMVVEVQQTSDVTYRLYDYDRTDSNGCRRELHVEKAREAIRYDDTDGGPVEYVVRMAVPTTVIRSPQFSTNVLVADAEFMRDYSESDTFVVLVAVDGEAEVTCGDVTMTLTRGTTVLVPASANGITISPRKKLTLLEAYIH